MIAIKIDTTRLKAKATRTKLAVIARAQVALARLAQEALKERFDWGGKIDVRGPRGGSSAYGRLRALGAVFVPVTLKHKRPERWPDLVPIYRARIVRGDATYQGRRIFWVDRRKLEALRARLLSRSLRKLSPGQWTLHIDQTDHQVTVILVKRGRREKGDAATVEAIKEYIREHFAEVAGAVLRGALRDAGFAA